MDTITKTSNVPPAGKGHIPQDSTAVDFVPDRLTAENKTLQVSAACIQVSDSEAILYVFGKLDSKRMKEIQQLAASDVILRDFIDSVILSKAEGQTDQEIIDEVASIRVKNLSEIGEFLPGHCE